MQNKYRRGNVSPLSIRQQGQQKTITGYAAMFHREYELGPGFSERIVPTAFSRSLESDDDIVALAHHNQATPLARRSAGTLRLRADSVGLAFEIDLPDTTIARDLAADISHGTINGASFGFRIRDRELITGERGTVQELRDIDLIEVSPVTFPANPATTIGMRSLDFGGAEAEELLHLYLARKRRRLAALRASELK